MKKLKKKLNIHYLSIPVLFLFLISAHFCIALTCNKDDVCLNNPLTSTPVATTPNQLIGQLINGILGVVGSLALAMFIYGGLTWMPPTSMFNRFSSF